MSIETLPFVSVQDDWEDVVREVASNTIPEGSFWIACYLTGKAFDIYFGLIRPGP